MSRFYNVTFEKVAVSAAQDLIQILGATGKMCRIRRMWVSDADVTPPANQQLQIRARVLGATVTNGSGGSTPSAAKIDQGDSNASFTAFANNTVKATTSGSATVVEENGCNVFAGFDCSYSNLDAPTIGVSEAFVFELLAATSGTLTLSGGVRVEEIGG